MRSSPQDDLLSDVQELARQRLGADERSELAATVPESAQRQLLDDTTYALQVVLAAPVTDCGADPPVGDRHCRP